MQAAGTVKVVRFNRPKYLGVLAIPVAAVIASTIGAPWPVSVILWAAGLPGLFWTASSIAATWWVYDHWQVYERLTAGLADAGEWAVVHAGFDDSVPALCASIGRPPAAVAEIAVAPGLSLRRARRLSHNLAACDPCGGLPLAVDPRT